MSRAPGFTLWELLVVLIVLGCLALIALPQTDGFQSERLANAAKLVVADLEYAQLCSLTGKADPCVVVIDTAANSYHLARASDPQQPLRNPFTGELYRRTFGVGAAAALESVVLDHTEFVTNDKIVFNAFGALDQGVDPHIVLRCGSQTVSIAVDAITGEAQMNEN